MKVIDATNAVLGRLASYASKNALEGEEIRIVNSEKAIIVGRKRKILSKFRGRRKRHGSSQKGPIYPTMPSKILKRTIRGMLPHKKERGSKALKRIKCYEGIPKELKDAKMIESDRGKKGVKLKIISKELR